MTPGEAATITVVARKLRGRIYAAEFPVGSKVPSRKALADEYGLSPESAGVVLRMLAAEGLVSLQQGSGTYVLPRRVYRAEITVQWTQDDVIPEGAFDATAEALAAAEEADPSVTDADLAGSSNLLTVAMDVATGGLSQAVSRAVAVARQVLGDNDGWDLAGASVEARPAGSDDT